MFRRLLSVLAIFLLPIRQALLWIWALQHRERMRLTNEMAEVRGLMPLIMKRRNGDQWSEIDRKKIRAHLRRLASLCPYLLLFVSPGGFFALPVLVWWIDRRRQKRNAEAQVAAK